MPSSGAGCAGTTATPATNAPMSLPISASRWRWGACQPRCNARQDRGSRVARTAGELSPRECPADRLLIHWRSRFKTITETHVRFRRAPETLMASKAIYTVVAAAGIAAASGAAWWYQNKAGTHGTEKAPAPAEGAQNGGTGGPA